MLARYLKAQLVVLLCGGLVGPIFLVVYFTLGLGSLLQWMFYVGLLITVADVLIALALANYRGQVVGQGGRARAERGAGARSDHRDHRDGDLGRTTSRSSRCTCASPDPELLPFDSEDRVIASVTRLGNLNARKVVVLVNPTTSEYRIDWERSALVNGLVPAQFTVAEDNKTYDLSGQAGPLMEILQILKANNVALNQMVDIRSNPALRAQIQAVVRRAVEQQAPAAQPRPPRRLRRPSSHRPQPSIAARLQELKDLHAGGALTDAEYTSRRTAIISEI